MAVKKKTTGKIAASARKPRKRTIGGSHNQQTSRFVNFIFPLFLIVGILFCLGFLSVMGYRTATASSFFDVKAVDIRGVTRASKDDIERIIKIQTNKSGVWNADLKEIKTDVEKLMFVKSAVVSRVLPDGIRIDVNERVPRVIVQLKSGNFWFDEDSVMLGAVKDGETKPPFVLRGWDDTKGDKSAQYNQERIKIYLKMLEEWNNFDLAKRVEAVDVSSLQRPQAIIKDSGQEVAIILSKDDFGKKLQAGIEGIVGRGNTIAAIDVSENKSVLSFRNKGAN